MAEFDAAVEAAATRAVVAGMVTQANAAIARLTDAATKWNITALTAVTNLTLSSLTAAAGTKPALATLTLPTYVAADFAALVAPALPSTPTLDGATAPMWSETFWANLKTRLTTFTDSIVNADDVDTAVTKLAGEQTRMESALFYRDYERKSQALRDLYSAADASTGAAGFSYPNSMTVALKLDAQQKFQFDLSETSRTLITHIFDWAKSNYQFSLQQGISAHNADADFNLRYLDASIKVYTATLDGLIKKYQADVAAAISKAELKLQEYTAQLNSELEKTFRLKELQLKEAGFDVELAKINAGIAADNIKLQIEDYKARVGNFLDTAKLNLEDRDANVKNQISASTAAAQAALALAAGASTITLNTGGA